MMALEKSHFEIGVEFVTKFNADVSKRDYSELTSLHYACLYSDLKMVKLLLSKGSEVGIKTVECRTEKDLTNDIQVRFFTFNVFVS